MKRLIILLAVALTATWAMTSCKSKSAADAEYQIQFSNPVEGSVYLACMTSDGMNNDLVDTLTAQDSLVKFTLDKFKELSPEAYVFVTPDRQLVYFLPQEGGLRFNEVAMGENAGSFFEMSADALSEDNVILNEFNQHMATFRGMEMGFRQQLAEADSAQAMQLFAEAQKAQENFQGNVRDLVQKHVTKQGASALVLINRDLYLDSIALFEEIQDQLPQGPIVDMMKEKVAAIRAIGAGNPFVDVELPTPDGATLKLSELAGKGNPVLLDFWASWCPPCRRENPHFREIYLAYKEKGFDIYAVSLDRNAEDWKKAIEDDQLEWHHVSNLDPRSCPAAATYMVKSIPSNVLIDGEGKIVGHNLMGDDLRAALDSLFAE